MKKINSQLLEDQDKDSEATLLGINELPEEVIKMLSPHKPNSRTIGMFGDIGAESASNIMSALIELQMDDPDRDITVFLNSPGGTVTDTLAIWDAFEACSCPITIIGVGKVMSAGAFLMYAGERGKRYLSPNTIVMAHQVSYGAIGTFSEMKVQHNVASMFKDRMLDLMASKANLKGNLASKRLKLAKVWENPHDQYFWPEEAILKIGLADYVGMPHRKEE